MESELPCQVLFIFSFMIEIFFISLFYFLFCVDGSQSVTRRDSLKHINLQYLKMGSVHPLVQGNSPMLMPGEWFPIPLVFCLFYFIFAFPFLSSLFIFSGVF